MRIQKTSLAILIYKIVSIAQIGLCVLLAVAIIYGITIPPHLAWGLNAVMAGLVLLLGLYFAFHFRAFLKLDAAAVGLSRFLGWDMVLHVVILLMLSGAVAGACYRVLSEGFAVFG